jgi:predicted phage gp36 major capsid-like protein
MPDGGVFDPKVIDEITREIRGLGDNWKGLSESMATDLAAVRRLAEETKGAVGPEVKAQIDALTASVTEKHAALETKFSARLTTLETKANRHGLGGGFSEAQDKAAAGRKRFHIQTLAGRGQLKAGNPVKDDEIDFKAIEDYEDTFPTYLRRDERGVETKALQVGSDPNGGYWVPDAMSNRIITQVYESSPIRQLATVETISTDALEVPNDLGEVAAGWVGEQEARPETGTPQTGVLRIPAHEMYSQPLEATALPRGLLTYTAGTTNPGQIEQIHSGDANLVTADSLIRISFSVKEPYMANARFLMQRSAVASVMLVKDTQQRLPLAAVLHGVPASQPRWLSDRVGGQYTRHRGGRHANRLRRLPAGVHHRGPARDFDPPRSVHRQAVRAVLHAAPGRRRCRQLRGL